MSSASPDMVVFAFNSLIKPPTSDITHARIILGASFKALRMFVPSCQAIAGVSFTSTPFSNELLKGVRVEIVFVKSSFFILLC